MTARVEDALEHFLEALHAGPGLPLAAVLTRNVEWHLVRAGGVGHLSVDAEGRVRGGRLLADPTLSVRLDLERRPDVLSGTASVPVMLARRELVIAGALDAALRLATRFADLRAAYADWMQLPAGPLTAHPTDPPARPMAPAIDVPSWPTARRTDLPARLTVAAIDQGLLLAALLGGLPADERAAEVERLLAAAEGHVRVATVVARVLVSLSDLATGTSDHLIERAEAELEPAVAYEPSFQEEH